MIIYIDCDMVFKKFERIALLTNGAVDKWNKFMDRPHGQYDSRFRVNIQDFPTFMPTITFPHVQTKTRKLYSISNNHNLSKSMSVIRYNYDMPNPIINLVNIETNKRLHIRGAHNHMCPIVFNSVHPKMSKIKINTGYLDQYHDTYCSQKERANSFMHPFLQFLLHIGIDISEIALVINSTYGRIGITLKDLLNDMASIEISLNDEFDTIRSFFNFIHARHMQHMLTDPQNYPTEFNFTSVVDNKPVFVPIPDLQLVKNELPYYYGYSFINDNIIKQVINVLYSGKYIAHMIIRGTSVLDIIMPNHQIDSFSLSYPIDGSTDNVITRPTIRLVSEVNTTIVDYQQNSMLSWLFAMGCKSENIRLRYNL